MNPDAPLAGGDPGQSVVFDRALYEEACRDYGANWRAMDDALYRICAEDPQGHADRGIVNARVGIVGRVYATGIERQIPSSESQGSALGILAGHLQRHHAEVDGIIAELAAISEPHTVEGLAKIVEGHGRFARIIASISRRQMLPHSFAAKYLHFHAPAVPIYDSVVRNEIERLTGRWRAKYEVFPLPEGGDSEYHRFVLRFWRLYQVIATSGAALTTKLVDHSLIYSEVAMG